MPTRKEVISYQSDVIQIERGCSSHLHTLSDQVPCVLLVNFKKGTGDTCAASLPMWILCLDKYLEENPVKISGDVVLYETHDRGDSRMGFRGRRLGFQLDVSEYMFGKKIYIFFYTEELKYLLDFELDLVIETIESPEVCYEELFQKSEENDTALELEGNILYVNKKFLSDNSDYFRCLFSENFADGKRSVIPIGLSTYEEFGMFFSKVLPGNEQEIRDDYGLLNLLKHIKIPDYEVEQLLELAQRYQFKLTTQKVEQHLISNSKFSIAKVLFIAEKHQLSDVIKGVLRDITDLDVMVNKLFPSYANLSESTKERMEEIQKSYKEPSQTILRCLRNHFHRR